MRNKEFHVDTVVFLLLRCRVLGPISARRDNTDLTTNFVVGLKKIACQQCGKSYAANSSLRRHLKYECQKEPRYVCPWCSKRTHLKSNLMQHIRLVHHQSTCDINSKMLEMDDVK
jgi:uncharacterized Zn-finger protein